MTVSLFIVLKKIMTKTLLHSTHFDFVLGNNKGCVDLHK